MSRKRVPLPKFGQTQSDSDLQGMEEDHKKQESDTVTLKNSSSGVNSEETIPSSNPNGSSTALNSANNVPSPQATNSVPISKKLSRITLRKLKIW